MLKPPSPTQHELEMVTLEELVPQDHLLRLIDQYIRFDFIREKTSHLYCADNGRPALDPVMLFKILFIGYLFGIRSERQLMREIQVNVAYRWFLGLRLTDKVPDASTLSQNRGRRFAGTGIEQQIFDAIVEQAIEHFRNAGRNLSRYPDCHPCAAERTLADADFSAIGLHDTGRHCQADALPGRGLVGAHATLQNALGLLRRDARPVIFHRQLQMAGFGSGTHFHSGVAPFVGIVEEIAEQFQQVPPVAAKIQGGFDVELRANLLVVINLVQRDDDFLCHRPERQRGGQRRCRSGGGRALQLVIDDMLHFPGFFGHRGGENTGRFTRLLR